jgi:hypothetical protein
MANVFFADRVARIWNVDAAQCLMVFGGGADTHNDQVISIVGVFFDFQKL